MDILSNANFEYNRLIKPIIYSTEESGQHENYGIDRAGHIFRSTAEGDLWLQRAMNQYVSPKIGVQQRQIAVSSATYNTKVYLVSGLTYSNFINGFIELFPDTSSVRYGRDVNDPAPPPGTKLNNFKFWMRTNIAVEFVLPTSGRQTGRIWCELKVDFYDQYGNLQSTKRLDTYALQIQNTVEFPDNVILQGDIIYPLEPQEYVRFYITNTMPLTVPPSLQGYMEHHELSEQNILTQFA